VEKYGAITAVLLDFDGTLVFLPTNYARMRSRLSKLFAHFGVKSTFRPVLDSVHDLLSKLADKNYPESLLREVRNKAYTIIDDEELVSVNQAQLANGVKEVLSFLQENGMKVAIISRNGIGCVQASIDTLSIPNPDLIVSRDDVNFEELKPAPRQVEIALDKLKLKPTEVIFVGDSLYDIQCGKSLGIQTILVAHDKNSENKELNPDFVITTLYGIINFLKRRANDTERYP